MEWYWYVLIIWIVGMFVAWQFIKKWDKSLIGKLYYTFVWPLVLPLYLIHYIHNLFAEKKDIM